MVDSISFLIQHFFNVLFWLGFIVTIIFILSVDLKFFNKISRGFTKHEALFRVLMWLGLTLVFATCLWYVWGIDKTQEFLSGYFLEKALSLDTILLFVMIFSFFDIPVKYQYKVLITGMLGAIVMRAFLVVGGVALLESFRWLTHVIGALFFITAFKMVLGKSSDETTTSGIKAFVMQKLKHYSLKVQYRKPGAFFVWQKGKVYFSSLFFALVCIELSDLVFAIDSIPVVYSVTQDAFIIFTSNIFAVLGIRSLYFLAAKYMQKNTKFLNWGLAIMFFIIGSKLFLGEFVKIPVYWTMFLLIGVMLSTLILSSIYPTKQIGVPKLSKSIPLH